MWSCDRFTAMIQRLPALLCGHLGAIKPFLGPIKSHLGCQCTLLGAIKPHLGVTVHKLGIFANALGVYCQKWSYLPKRSQCFWDYVFFFGRSMTKNVHVHIIPNVFEFSHVFRLLPNLQGHLKKFVGRGDKNSTRGHVSRYPPTCRLISPNFFHILPK